MHFVALPENQENAYKILIFRHEFKFLQIVCRNQCTVPRAARRMNPTFFLTLVFLFWIRVFSCVTWCASSNHVCGWNWNISTEEESNSILVYEVWNTKHTDIRRLKHKNVSNSFNYHPTRLILRLWERSFFESVNFWDLSFWNSFIKRTMNNSFKKRPEVNHL